MHTYTHTHTRTHAHVRRYYIVHPTATGTRHASIMPSASYYYLFGWKVNYKNNIGIYYYPHHDIGGGESRWHFHYCCWVCIFIRIFLNVKTDVRKLRPVPARRCDNAAYAYGENPVRFFDPLRVIYVINRTPRSLVRLVGTRTDRTRSPL